MLPSTDQIRSEAFKYGPGACCTVEPLELLFPSEVDVVGDHSGGPHLPYGLGWSREGGLQWLVELARDAPPDYDDPRVALTRGAAQLVAQPPPATTWEQLIAPAYATVWK